ncbi:MAG: hypothetical protein ABSD92_10500 [Candidatus Bathyarchaeia archaeon]
MEILFSDLWVEFKYTENEWNNRRNLTSSAEKQMEAWFEHQFLGRVNDYGTLRHDILVKIIYRVRCWKSLNDAKKAAIDIFNYYTGKGYPIPKFKENIPETKKN